MIRRANQNDIDGLLKLLLQVQKLHAEGRPDVFKLGGQKYVAEQLKEIISDESTPVYVCIEEEKLAGYAFCIFRQTEENTSLKFRKTLYIDDLCVDESMRRRNIGTKLYDYVVNVAKESECDSVTLNVWELNSSAKAFYEKRGMKPLKTVMEQVL